MAAIRRISITHCSYHLVWILTLLEAITVPILAFFMTDQARMGQPKSLWQGFVIGFIGTSVLLSVLNIFLDRLRIKIFNQTMQRINILATSIWGGLLLGFIFLIQHLVIKLLQTMSLTTLIISGFLSASLAILISFLIYRILYLMTDKLSIQINTARAKYVFISFSFLEMALLVGIYEAIVLPISNAFMYFPNNQKILIAFFTGSISGFLGALIVVWLTNKVLLRKNLYLYFKE